MKLGLGDSEQLRKDEEITGVFEAERRLIMIAKAFGMLLDYWLGESTPSVNMERPYRVRFGADVAVAQGQITELPKTRVRVNSPRSGLS